MDDDRIAAAALRPNQRIRIVGPREKIDALLRQFDVQAPASGMAPIWGVPVEVDDTLDEIWIEGWVRPST